MPSRKERLRNKREFWRRDIFRPGRRVVVRPTRSTSRIYSGTAFPARVLQLWSRLLRPLGL